MRKFCVFCGQAPEEKNREHVIPKWLIELTGDPKRIARFGITFEKPFRLREFSFDALVFPACASCNTRFGLLEEQIRPLFSKLLSYEPISQNELITLLDWLDKIRVGLWLGYLYLDKNPFGINPNFHVESRLGRSDRMLSTLKADHQGKGLSFVGPSFKGYQLSPTCFALRINELWLVNAAGVSLCSQRLGFPYLEPVQIREDNKLEAHLKHGSERIMIPLERRLPLPRSVSIYQPVFRAFIDLKEEQFLQSEWVKARTANGELGYGRLFLQRENSVQMYPEEASGLWVPVETWNGIDTLRELGVYVHRRIHEDCSNGPRLATSTPQRKRMRMHGALAKMADRSLLKNLAKSLKESARETGNDP